MSNLSGRHMAAEGGVTKSGAISAIIKTGLVIDLPDAASGDVDLVLDADFELTNVFTAKMIAKGVVDDKIAIKDGSGNVVVPLFAFGNGGGSIGDVDRCVAVSSAYSSFSKGDTLRITRERGGGGNTACRLVLVGAK